MKHIVSAILGAALLLLVGCGGSPKNSPTQSPGSFGFKSLVVPKASAAQQNEAPAMLAAASATDFNFGDIPSTQTYLFELRNTGLVAVHDINIASDNPAVRVTPSTIGVLPTEGTGSVIPIISVQVIHGVGMNGYGSAATLTPGSFTFHLTANGLDAYNNTINTGASVALNVQVASFEVWAGDTDSTGYVYPATLQTIGVCREPQGTSSVPGSKAMRSWDGLTAYPATGWWFVQEAVTMLNPRSTSLNRVFTIKNTGNCPLTLTDFGKYGNATSETFTMAAGIELAKVIFHLRQASTTSRRDLARAAAMASSPYSVGSMPTQSGKTGTMQEILNAFKAYLS